MRTCEGGDGTLPPLRRSPSPFRGGFWGRGRRRVGSPERGAGPAGPEGLRCWTVGKMRRGVYPPAALGAAVLPLRREAFGRVPFRLMGPKVSKGRSESPLVGPQADSPCWSGGKMQRGVYPPAAHEGGCPPSAEGGKIFPLMKHWGRRDGTPPPPAGGTSPFRGGFWGACAAAGKAPLKGELAR